MATQKKELKSVDKPDIGSLYQQLISIEASIKDNEDEMINLQIELNQKKSKRIALRDQVWDLKKSLAELMGIPMQESTLQPVILPFDASTATVTPIASEVPSTGHMDAFQRRAQRRKEAKAQGLETNTSNKIKFEESLANAQNSNTIKNDDGSVTKLTELASTFGSGE